MDYSLNIPEDPNEPSLFEKMHPLLHRWQLNELKKQQTKARGGRGKIALSTENKRIEAAMRQILDGNQN